MQPYGPAHPKFKLGGDGNSHAVSAWSLATFLQLSFRLPDTLLFVSPGDSAMEDDPPILMVVELERNLSHLPCRSD